MGKDKAAVRNLRNRKAKEKAVGLFEVGAIAGTVAGVESA